MRAVRFRILDGLAEKYDGRFTYETKNGHFLTAFLNYAPDVYKIEHVYFVLKQDMDRRLPDALDKALKKRIDLTISTPHFTIRQRHSVTQISIYDVLFLERSGRKTRLSLKSEDIWTTQSPETLLEADQAKIFIRCHQSYWAN